LKTLVHQILVTHYITYQSLTMHTCFTVGVWKWQCCQFYAPVAFTSQEIFW